MDMKINRMEIFALQQDKEHIRAERRFSLRHRMSMRDYCERLASKKIFFKERKEKKKNTYFMELE